MERNYYNIFMKDDFGYEVYTEDKSRVIVLEKKKLKWYQKLWKWIKKIFELPLS